MVWRRVRGFKRPKEMKAENFEDIYELSPMQLGMLFQQLYDPEATRYVVQFVITLSGELSRILAQSTQIGDRNAIGWIWTFNY